eukprot:1247485-Amphidinium_carterae.1
MEFCKRACTAAHTPHLKLWGLGGLHMLPCRNHLWHDKGYTSLTALTHHTVLAGERTSIFWHAAF